MLVLLSPAKKMDFESEIPTLKTTKVDFLKDSESLIKGLKKLNPKKIAKLMNVSDAIAELTLIVFKIGKYHLTLPKPEQLFLLSMEKRIQGWMLVL